MSKHKYAIGLDFGTESGRSVWVDVTDGREVATAVHSYGHGVIDEVLPGTDIELPGDFALQNPGDYIEVLRLTIPAVLREAGLDPQEVKWAVADCLAVLAPDDTGLVLAPSNRLITDVLLENVEALLAAVTAPQSPPSAGARGMGPWAEKPIRTKWGS